MHFHAGVHATESRGSGKKTRSKVQTNVPPTGAPWCPIEDSPQWRFTTTSAFLPFRRHRTSSLPRLSLSSRGDTPSYPSTPLLFRIRGYTPPLAPGLWDFMRAKAVYAPWIFSDLLFSSYFNGNGCRMSTREASRSNNVDTSIQKESLLDLKESTCAITVFNKTVWKVRNYVEYFKKLYKNLIYEK